MKEYNIRLILEYDGTGFHGWQRQKGVVTVQETLESVLSRITKEEIKITGAGRTDAGVHAIGQAASFKSNLRLPELSWIRAINSLLPRDIIVRKADYVPEDFSARHNARSKTYQYIILNSELPSPFLRNYVWHIKYPLDVAAMKKACKYLTGTHDFSSFRASSCSAASPVRTLERLEIRKGRPKPGTAPLFLPVNRASVPGSGGYIILTFHARSFLQHMVRNIVGTLAMTGSRKIKPLSVRDILEMKDRCAAGPIAPSHGLYLKEVQFNI